MEIETLRELCNVGSIKWTKHCLERMQERDITIADVKNCIIHGEIIEDYPDDFPNPSELIYGVDIDGRVLHTVCGTDGKVIFAITAYYPDSEVFMQDLKTRRE